MEKLMNENGEYTISNKAIKDIVQIACKQIDEFAPSKNQNDFVIVECNKDNELKITIQVRVKQGIDLCKACDVLQEEVNDNLLLMTGVDCKNINIDIQGFIYDKKN